MPTRALQFVGVLKLVHQDVLKAPLVVHADGVVVAQQLVTAQHQLAKIDHAFALALLFVELVELDLLARVHVVCGHRHVAGAHALFLAARNEILQLLGWKAFVVHVVLLAQALDGRQLVLRVQNLKRLRQARRLVVRTQEPVAQAVEGANPHTAHADREHGRQARDHFLGGFVGKRHGQNAARRGQAVLHQPGDARGQHPRFARAGASQDERVSGGQRDSGELLGVEVRQQRRNGDAGCSANGRWCARKQVLWKHGPIVESRPAAGTVRQGVKRMGTIGHRAQVSCSPVFCACALRGSVVLCGLHPQDRSASQAPTAAKIVLLRPSTELGI